MGTAYLLQYNGRMELPKLLRAWSVDVGLVAHQIQSFDKFISCQLNQIISENSDIVVENEAKGVRHVVTFGNVCVRRPAVRESDGAFHKVTPLECRSRGLTYLSPIYVDITHTEHSTGVRPVTKVYKEVLICKVPCMVGSSFCNLRTNSMLGPSGECPFDVGGYFIVNGNEKVVVAQEKTITNYPLVRTSQSSGKTQYFVEIRSLHSSKTRSTSTLQVHMGTRKIGAGHNITVLLPFVDCQVPCAYIYTLLGVSDESDIVEHVVRFCPEEKKEAVAEFLRAALEIQGERLHDVEAIIDKIGKEGTREPSNNRRVRYVEHILANELLPHMGLDNTEETKRRKLDMLSVSVLKLCRVTMDHFPPDDRDDYRMKRIDTSGVLFALLFRQLFRNSLKLLSMQLTRAVENGKSLIVVDMVNPKRISGGFKYALSTGNWGIQKASTANGVAQVLSRLNYAATVSHLRRVNTPLCREGKLPRPRQLAISHYGLLCPVETPEGAACGLIENLSMLTYVRVGFSAAKIVKSLPQYGMQPLRQIGHVGTVVMVNGAVEGMCDDGEGLVARLREARRESRVPWDTSIAYVENSDLVRVDTDAGCLLRPLIRRSCLEDVKRCVATMTVHGLWKHLVSCGYVEYLDKNEELSATVAMDLDSLKEHTTHVEIHPVCLLGISAAMIPFSNHNQAPRNIYETSMSKQSLAVYSLAYEDRMDSLAHVLWNGQCPLVTTVASNLGEHTISSSGANVIVAIVSYTAFNCEDSIIMNKAALDRGLFRSVCYKCFKDEEKGVGSDVEKFGSVPPSATGSKSACYSKVGVDGLPSPGTTLVDKDVVMAKKMTTSMLGHDKKKKSMTVDHSTVLRSSEAMVVDRVIVTLSKEGNRVAKVRLRSCRTPMIGDKFSSHHGQKGVVGAVLPQVDMPYTADGLIPDLLINPHAIPSRMTIAQLLEGLLGKACCITGQDGDGTPFEKGRIDGIRADLMKGGYNSYGNEYLYSGYTGERMRDPVFIAPVHYQRLRHLVQDKVHARSRGPISLISRQPVEGRSRDGGLRFGEMERDCVVAHGATSVLLDRLFEQSDEYVTAVCMKCGIIAESISPDASQLTVHTGDFCRGCNLRGPDHITKVRVPYAFKLFAQELSGCNVAVRLRFDGAKGHR